MAGVLKDAVVSDRVLTTEEWLAWLEDDTALLLDRLKLALEEIERGNVELRVRIAKLQAELLDCQGGRVKPG